MSSESSSSYSSGGFCQIILTAIYIYIMVIFFMNTLPLYSNNYVYEGLTDVFRDQIDWMYIFGLYHTIMFFLSSGLVVISALLLCCVKDIAIGLLLTILCASTLSNVIAQSIFVNSGNELSSELNIFCFNNVNNVTLCNYYKNEFNPSYIINIVLLCINSINLLIILISSIVACVNDCNGRNCCNDHNCC